MVERRLVELAPDHPLRSYMAIAPDLGYDAGLVDTFLHGRERNYSVGECQELVASSGLVFQDLFFKSNYHPPANPANPFHKAVAALSRERQWAIMEQINFRNGCHFFMACRSDRPASRYVIDFATGQALDFIPSLRHRCHLRDAQICRNDWCMTLDANQLVLTRLVDGHRTIRDIAALARVASGHPPQQQAPFEKFVQEQFRVFWQLDFMAMALPSVAAR